MPPRGPVPSLAEVNADAALRERVTAAILSKCREAGFVLTGIAPARPHAHAAALTAWLAAGKHGEMEYMARDVEVRLDPALIMPGTRSFVMVADLYASRNDLPDASEPGAGRIARYARGRDYHQSVKRRLHRIADQVRLDVPGSDFRSFADTAPVPERELAVLAGLGWQAKNTMVINPRLGSWLLLGGMATNIDLVPAPEPVADACGTCTRCIDACPTGAITPYSVDGSRCVSYLTIEHRSELAAVLAPGVRDWLAGCDICQEVCPHNSPRQDPPAPVNAAYAPRARSLPILRVLDWTEEDRRRAFETSALKRITLEMVKRNAIAAAGNQLRLRDDPALRARIARVAADPTESELIRRTAREVLGG